MTAQVYNNVQDTLALSVEDSATEIRVTDGSKFPAVADGDYIPLYVLASNGSYEIMHVTAVNGNVLTVERGQENTDTLTFSGGETVQIRLTRESLLSIVSGGDTKFRAASSYDELRAMDGNPGEIVYLSDGDRSGFFSYSTGLEDDGGVVLGSWVRVRDDDSLAMVEWYGDTADDIQRAMDNNRTVRFKPGKTYTMDSVVYSAQKDIRLEFNGCKIYQPLTNAEGTFYLFGGWGNVIDLTGFTDGEYPYVTAQSPVGVGRGDVVKLSTGAPYEFFTDQVIGGEFREVWASEENGTRVKFSGPLRFDYSRSTSKICKLEKYDIELIGPVEFDQEQGATSYDDYPTYTVIRIGSAYQPLIENLGCKFTYTSFITTWSCYNAIIRNTSVGYGANQSDGSDFEGSDFRGYGVRDCNSHNTYVENLNVSNTRHGFVAIGSGGGDSGPNVVRGLSDIGPNMNARVVNSTGTGCTNSPFDTHHGQEYTHFINCNTYRCRGSGFQARGVGTRFTGCVSNSDDMGVTAFVQSAYVGGQGITDQTVWENGTIINPATRAYRANEEAGIFTVTNSRVVIDGNGPATLNELCYSSRATHNRFYNNTLDVDAPLSNLSYLFSFSDPTSLYIDGLTVNCTPGNEFNAGAMINAGAGLNLFANGINIMRGKFSNLISSNPNSGGKVTNVYGSFSDTIVDGVSDSSIQDMANMIGPIHKNRDYSYGTASIQSGTGYIKYPDGTLICYGEYASAVSKTFPVRFASSMPIVTAIPYNENSGDQSVVITKISNSYFMADTKTSSGNTSSTGGFYQAMGRWK